MQINIQLSKRENSVFASAASKPIHDRPRYCKHAHTQLDAGRVRFRHTKASMHICTRYTRIFMFRRQFSDRGPMTCTFGNRISTSNQSVCPCVPVSMLLSPRPCDTSLFLSSFFLCRFITDMIIHLHDIMCYNVMQWCCLCAGMFIMRAPITDALNSSGRTNDQRYNGEIVCGTECVQPPSSFADS